MTLHFRTPLQYQKSNHQFYLLNDYKTKVIFFLFGKYRRDSVDKLLNAEKMEFHKQVNNLEVTTRLQVNRHQVVCYFD